MINVDDEDDDDTEVGRVVSYVNWDGGDFDDVEGRSFKLLLVMAEGG